MSKSIAAVLVVLSLGAAFCLAPMGRLAAEEAPLDRGPPTIVAELVGLDAPPNKDSGIAVEWMDESVEPAVKKSISWPGGLSMELPKDVGYPVTITSPKWKFTMIGGMPAANNRIHVTFAAWQEAKVKFRVMGADGSAVDFTKPGEALLRAWPVSPGAGLLDKRMKIERFKDTANILELSSGTYAIRMCVAQEGTVRLAHQLAEIKPGDSEYTVTLSRSVQWVECEINDETGHCAGENVVFANCGRGFNTLMMAMKTARRISQTEARSVGGSPDTLVAARLFGFFTQDGELAETSKAGGKAWFPDTDMGDWVAVAPDQLGIYQAKLDVKAKKVTVSALPGACSVKITVNRPADAAPDWDGVEIQEDVDLSRGGRTVESLRPRIPAPQNEDKPWPRTVTIRSIPAGDYEISLMVEKGKQAPHTQGQSNRVTLRLDAGKSTDITLPAVLPKR